MVHMGRQRRSGVTGRRELDGGSGGGGIGSCRRRRRGDGGRTRRLMRRRRSEIRTERTEGEVGRRHCHVAHVIVRLMIDVRRMI